MPAPSSSDSAWLPTSSTTRHRRIRRPMGFKNSVWLPLLVGSVLFSNVATAAISLIYCSKENTGSDYPVFNDIYQSDGKCHDRCQGKYAFAIVLYQNCWCSNYAPGETENLGDCSDSCPGYPDDRCGNRQKNYYNYIELDNLPSSRTDLPSSTSTPNKDSTTGSPTADQSQTPIISVTTILGSQKTITITPTATGPNNSSFPMGAGGSQNFFSNAGRVAGVFVSIFAAVIGIVGLIFFIRKRRNDRRNSVVSSTHPEMGMSGPGSPTMGTTGSSSPNARPRSTSTLGFVGGGTLTDKAPVITTTGFAETDRVTDQRLDPNQIWMRFDNDNGSRVSLRSLQDNQDYSRRVLKLTNPDA